VDEIKIDDFVMTRYYSIYFPSEKMAVLSDLHIGFEEVMAEKGLLLPKMQKNKIIELLERIYNYYDVEKILIDGDFKHEFSKNVRQEWDEIEEIIRYISDRSDLIVVKGNHDNYLQTILSKYGIQIMKYYNMGNYTFVHGDKVIDFKNHFIIGHEHPSIKIRDRVGGMVSMPSFLHGHGITVLPSPSIYSSGSDVLNGEILSPLLKNFDIDSLNVYAVDDKLGLIDLGKISEIRKIEDEFRVF